MPKTIEAIYENGVFKPIKKIHLKDRQQVRIRIISEDDWQRRFKKVLQSIRSKTSKFPPEEVEADIEEAIKEVRRARRARTT